MTFKVLVIGWDAADWKIITPLMEQGKMPNLLRLVERGVMGNLATLQPVLSPMLWTTIATGKRPFKHGIMGFTEPTPDGGGVQPVSQLSRTTKAIWNILNQSGYRSTVVGWWPSHPVEPIDGVMISNQYHIAVGPPDQPWPVVPGSIHPKRLAKQLAELRFNPNELVPKELIPFIPKALEIDQDKDRRLASVMKVLAECTTINNAATWLIRNEPWDFFGVYFDAIDHFCHGFMRYHPPRLDWIKETDFDIYCGVVNTGYRYHDMMLGALLSQIDEQETTVILCSDHGFHSDHLRPRHIPVEPAGPAVEHRDLGVLVMAGPGIKKDELIHGATLLDITPTILTLYGLPVGEDMDGKPLVQAFESAPAIKHIPSWDEVPGKDGRRSQEQRFDPLAAKAALDQLVQLGYVDESGPDKGKAVEHTARELRYNLARAYMNADQSSDALPILTELYHSDPEEYRFGLHLAMCHRSLGSTAELRPLVEDIARNREAAALKAQERLKELRDLAKQRMTEREAAATRSEGLIDEQLDEAAVGAGDHAGWVPSAGAAKQEPLFNRQEHLEWRRMRSHAQYNRYDLDFLTSCVCLDERDFQGALEYLKRAEAAEPSRPGLHIQIGETYLGMRLWVKAEDAYRKALEIDPLNSHAHLGMARSLLPRGLWEDAAREALETLRLLYHYPLAHFILGRALLQMHHFDAAERSLQVAVSLNPNFYKAHRLLVWLYRFRLNKPEKALEHTGIIAKLRQLRDGKLNLAQNEPAEPERGVAGQTETTALVGENEIEALSPITRSRLPGPDAPTEFVTVVTGLPRSGTSMLMQMIDAGGLPILTDGKRKADKDNPRGYYEFVKATKLRQQKSWVKNGVGKAVKIVAQLLPYLPTDLTYRILFVERHLDEVLASQEIMLKRLKRKPSSFSKKQIQNAYVRQLRDVKLRLASNQDIFCLYLQHRDILDQPNDAAQQINQFLGGHLDIQAMAAAVDGSLHRQKVG